MGCKTDERPSRSCLLQWLTISGWCVQGLIEQRYFILSYCSRSKVRPAVKGRRPKRADVSAPCVVTRHNTEGEILPSSVGVMWTCVAQTGLVPAPPACFCPSSFSIFTSTLAISSALQASSLFFPLCLAFLTAAKLCWFHRVTPAPIVSAPPPISFPLALPHPSSIILNLSGMLSVWILVSWCSVFFLLLTAVFFTTIKINHRFSRPGWVSYGLYYHY